jgi:glycosyltransferase involved in cell wall biosynthesis
MRKVLDFSIVIPCLNEEETIGKCVEIALFSANQQGYEVEIIVADNGSTDASKEISTRAGANVLSVATRGYGAAIDAGIRSAKSEYIVVADGDLSYDFSRAHEYFSRLKNGKYDLVIGNRFRGGIAKGAMPPLHRYLGNPVLSFLARFFFRIPIGDFHCGMRGINKSIYIKAAPRTAGMEFATEMVLRMIEAGAKLIEIPTTLVQDGRSRKPHLRSFPDGWRHLKLMFLFAPQFTFLIPGFFISLVGLLLLSQYTLTGEISLGFASTGIIGGLIALVVFVVGIQMFTTGAIAIAFAKSKGVNRFRWMPINYNKARAIFVTVTPVLLILLGLVGFVILGLEWIALGFGHLDPINSTRIGFPSAALIVSGISLLIGAIQVRQTISKFW